MIELKSKLGTALFSDDYKYRYLLTRPIGEPGGSLFQRPPGTCLFVMLNPSDATHEINDPTVRRCMGYAEDWGCGMLVVANLFALKSSDPDKLYHDPDPIGPDNDDALEGAAGSATTIICAWGTHGKLFQRGRSVLRMLRTWLPQYLTLTKDGQPGHPLYLKADLKPQHFPKD